MANPKLVRCVDGNYRYFLKVEHIIDKHIITDVCKAVKQDCKENFPANKSAVFFLCKEYLHKEGYNLWAAVEGCPDLNVDELKKLKEWFPVLFSQP